MANMIKGEEQKFAINITVEGFSMDADDFDVMVSSPRNNVIGSKVGAVEDTSVLYKTGSTDVTISREPDVTENEETVTGGWFVVVDTQNLSTGDLTVTITAHIRDTAANDGVRNSLARTSLGTLRN